MLASIVWSPIAQFTASAIALSIATAPLGWRYLRRPRLVAILGSAEPHVRPFFESESRTSAGITELRLRVEIRNDGRTEARRVRARVIRWWSSDADRERPWTQYDLDPFVLGWVGVPHAETERPDESFVDIAAGAFDLAELASVDMRHARLTLRAARPNYQPPGSEATSTLGEHRVELVVTAENAALIRVVVGFALQTDHFFASVAESVEPRGDAVRKLGYLRVVGPLMQPSE